MARLFIVGKKTEESYIKGGISLTWLRDWYTQCPLTINKDIIMLYTQAYVLYLCGAVLFPTESKNIANIRYIQILFNPHKIRKYAWGA